MEYTPIYMTQMIQNFLEKTPIRFVSNTYPSTSLLEVRLPVWKLDVMFPVGDCELWLEYTTIYMIWVIQNL